MEFLTIAEAARRLAISPRQINAYCRAGQLGTRMIGSGGRWLITAAEIEDFEKRPVGNPNFSAKKARKKRRKVNKTKDLRPNPKKSSSPD
jgi:excisionase family DNA binding protein